MANAAPSDCLTSPWADFCPSTNPRESSRLWSKVEAHPHLPETELLEFCKKNNIVFLAFAPLGHGIRPGPLEDPVISAIAARVAKTPAQVLLAWGVQRGTALLTTPRTAARARENFNISALPEEALDEINRIQARQRFNEVVKTGSPGFIPQGR